MKIYFGDNQFLGVNHSEGKGINYQKKYNSPEEIAVTLREAWDVGIRDFCFTVNQKTIDAINLIITDCPFQLHPALPYAHRVNDLIAQKGLPGALSEKVKSAGFFHSLIASFKVLKGKYDSAFKLLITTELEGIPLKHIKSIGLLNIASDFLLGLKRDDLLHSFYRAVKDGFGKTPLFYTLNFPSLAESLWDKGLNDSIIVFNCNSKGFRTNPNLDNVKESIKKYKNNHTVAMSIFSGSNVEDLNRLFSDIPELSGVLFGSSQKKNIINNFDFFDRI